MKEQDYLHEKQIDEAIKRLEALSFSDDVIKEFIDDGIIYISINNRARRIEEKMLADIREWEEENNLVIYHVIKSQLKGDLTYSLLFVDDVSKSWTEDRKKLKIGRLTVYTFVPEKDGHSFFEEAIIERHDEGLARVK